MSRGYFISIEGGDGSGKSTQLQHIREYMEERKIDALFTREPGGTPIGEQVRRVILDPGNTGMAGMTEALLYAAARAQIVREVIRPAIEAGRTVVCDRFVDSSLAYQGYARGLGDAVGAINAYAVDGLMPDMTIFLDISPVDALHRVDNEDRGERDRLELEAAAFHMDVYRGYKALIEADRESGGHRFFTVDASLPPEEVRKRIAAGLDALFGFTAE